MSIKLYSIHNQLSAGYNGMIVGGSFGEVGEIRESGKKMNVEMGGAIDWKEREPLL